MTAATTLPEPGGSRPSGLRLVPVRWQRPAWTSSPLSTRWLVFSLVLHLSVLTGLAGLGLWESRAPARPRPAMHRVLGAEPLPPPPPEERTPWLEVETEEELTVELLPTPEIEPPPFLDPRTVVWEPVPEDAKPRRQPDRTVIRRVLPEPPIEPVAKAEDPPPPPEPEPTAPTGNATAPVPVDEANQPPSYPRRAIRLCQEGTVVLRVEVAVDGRVLACQIASSSGFTLLDRAALEAVRKWRFSGSGALDLPVEFVLTSVTAPS